MLFHPLYLQSLLLFWSSALLKKIYLFSFSNFCFALYILNITYEKNRWYLNLCIWCISPNTVASRCSQFPVSDSSLPLLMAKQYSTFHIFCIHSYVDEYVVTSKIVSVFDRNKDAITSKNCLIKNNNNKYRGDFRFSVQHTRSKKSSLLQLQ